MCIERSMQFIRSRKEICDRVRLLGVFSGYGKCDRVRGVSTLSLHNILLMKDYGMLSDKETDTKIYSLHRFVEMLKVGEIEALELLGLPEDKYIITSDIMKRLIQNAGMFFSKRYIYMVEERNSRIVDTLKNIKDEDGECDKTNSMMAEAVITWSECSTLLREKEIVLYNDSDGLIADILKGEYTRKDGRPKTAFFNILHDKHNEFKEYVEKYGESLPDVPDNEQIDMFMTVELYSDLME